MQIVASAVNLKHVPNEIMHLLFNTLFFAFALLPHCSFFIGDNFVIYAIFNIQNVCNPNKCNILLNACCRQSYKLCKRLAKYAQNIFIELRKNKRIKQKHS